MLSKKGPGRPRKSERRRQPGIHGRGRQKLITPEITGFTTRWVNDISNRLKEKTQYDDWEFVEAREINNEVGEAGDGNQDLGSRVKRVVGTQEGGKPMYAYLLKKSNEYYKQDIANNEAARREKEDTLRRGTGSDGRPVDNQYGSIK